MFNSFSDSVKIKSTPETIEKGLAGKTGEIHGETTPSIMDIEVIGKPKEDKAYNVYFEEEGTSFWFDPELLELVDSGEGTVITLDGVDKKWTKGKDGEWTVESTASKKWWQFWKS